jgi:Uma2 family endonuclease
MNLAAVGEAVRIPGWIVDLESFRRWAKSSDFPTRGWFSHLGGDLWVDLSMETLAHNQVKGEVAATLAALVKGAKLGRLLPDRMRLTHIKAKLSTESDAMFISQQALRSGQVLLPQGAESLEAEGTPDMVLEVVSPTSEQRDKVDLRELYWKAGISEYWLIDPGADELSFEILKRTAKGYVATRPQGGWLKSAVFGKSFRLTQTEDELGYPVYTLEVR